MDTRIFNYKIKSRKPLSPKLKMCRGYGIPAHEAYIYKNIDGYPYCKSCALRKQPPKPINKVSTKMKFKMVLKKNLIRDDHQFYLSVWKKRFYDLSGTLLIRTPKCECCQKKLGFEPLTTYFHHILEKRNYPELRHEKENIAILCPECHSRYETFPDNVPYLVNLRKTMLDLFNKGYFNKTNNINQNQKQTNGQEQEKPIS